MDCLTVWTLHEMIPCDQILLQPEAFHFQLGETHLGIIYKLMKIYEHFIGSWNNSLSPKHLGCAQIPPRGS